MLTTTGAKSGQKRISPVAYLSEGGQIYIFAGNRGASTNPNWFYNIVANPDVTVEVGTEKFEATAIVVESKEGDRLLGLQVKKLPGLAQVGARTNRKIPALLLERKS